MNKWNNKALIENIKQLIAIESVPSKPAELRHAYEFVRARIAELGKPITIEEFESNGIPSLLAYSSSSTRPPVFHIILNGHVDVIPGTPEQFQPCVTDGKLYGRGAYDMKAALMVLIDTFCEYVDKVPFPLALQITSDEESAGVNGVQHQIQQGVRGNFVICGESGRAVGTHEIANQAKGIVIANVRFGGNSAHGAYPWNGDNAALKAAHFVSCLHEHYPTPQAETAETTMTVTSIISTSEAHTRIPDTATAKIDARYIAGDPNFHSKAHFEALLRSIDPNIQHIDYFDFSAPVYTNPKNPLLLTLKAAAERTEHAPFAFVCRNATSDGRHFGSVGNEACEFGIAGQNQHGDNEYVPLQAIFDYRAALCDFLTHAARSS